MSGGAPEEAGHEPEAASGSRVVRFCLDQKLVLFLAALFAVAAGLVVAPFDWNVAGLPRDPVPVDAIPDLGENQQIVFTEWMGRSPQDVEDQVTYPLTVALLGLPEVRTVRSTSAFGFSSIYVIFEEGVEFYWARSRVLEKLASLPSGTLPDEVRPALGPDATGLGQIFWYTLEGRGPDGEPLGGWGLDELRSLQDWTVRYALLAASGVSEVASIGGFVSEYQVDVDPGAMRAFGIGLDDVFRAVRDSNLDVGARTIEINRVEYVVRGRGFLESLEDLESAVVRVVDGVPVTIAQLARVTRGPGLRRGALDKGGAEAVGGVVVARYGANPLAVIDAVKRAAEELGPALPTRPVLLPGAPDREAVAAWAAARGFEAWDGPELAEEAWNNWLRATPRAEWPEWATTSTVTLVPFYDRTQLIHETLGTLEHALTQEIMITVLVVVLMLWHLASSALIAALLPLAVLLAFVAMRIFGVDANIVALSGIAIAIGTMVDMGIVVAENVLERLRQAPPGSNRREVVQRATTEVAGAVLTAVATTVVSFLPVFTMTGAEGKLFKPLAFTKTFALIAAVVLALTLLPAAAHVLFRRERPGRIARSGRALASLAVALVVAVFLTDSWLPLGHGTSRAANLIFVGVLVGGTLFGAHVFQRSYPRLLALVLQYKSAFLVLPLLLIAFAASVWLGFAQVFQLLPGTAAALGASPEWVTGSRLWTTLDDALPGLGREFMPALDEGSFLFMPSTMPHASIGEALDALALQDARIAAIPEVVSVVGKIGRAETALDPAPVSMVETVIAYSPEYRQDADGEPLLYAWDAERGEHVRDADGALVPDPEGRPFRQWRDEIQSPDDIWAEIAEAGKIPGSTSAPKLQPIETRLVMLQTGMRAPMGIKVRGPDLESIEAAGVALEAVLKEAPGVEPAAVFADRVVGKPYLEIDIDRQAIARYGLSVKTVQEAIEIAVGGRRITTTVEGRERYPVRVRYPREQRSDIEALEGLLVQAPGGQQIPLRQLAEVEYVRGPQAIKSEDTFLVAYVIFDRLPGWAEVDAVESARAHVEAALERGRLELPTGVTYRFTGNYENQLRARRTLAAVLPASLLVIFILLYLQFRSVGTTLFVFSGVAVAWSGGFLLLWLYGREGFLDFDVFGTNLRELFAVSPRNMSVAVWVGFLALFGIATDDGVLFATYLRQRFGETSPGDRAGIRAAVVAAASRRIRPALMTSATTVLALLPVLTSRGRGADIMVPMALPAFGGMVVALLTVFVVPVLWCWREEWQLDRGR